MNSKLNNDAVTYIQSKQYRRATLILNKALLISKYGGECNVFETSPFRRETAEMRSADDYISSDCCMLLEEEQEPLDEDYDEGMNTFPDPYNIPSTKLDSNEFTKMVLCYNLGIVHLKSRNNEDALAYFDKAWSDDTTLQSMHDSGVSMVCSFDAQEKIALMHNLAYSYFRCDHFTESLMFYDKALDLALQAYGYFHISVSMTLNCIGVVRLHSFDAKKGSDDILGLFMESIAINEAISSTKCQYRAMNATILNNIGRVQFARKEYHEAKARYEESYRIRVALYGPMHIDVAAVLYNIGEVQQILGFSEEAIALYQKFLSIVTVHLGRRDFDVAVIFKKIAQIYYERAESEKAIEMYLKALDIVKSCLGETHSEVTSILNKIGNICYRRQEYDIALKVYEEGLKIERQILDHDHPNIIITTINIARIHHQLGNLDQALVLHDEALTMQRENCLTKADRINIACTLSSIGLINDQRKQYWLAIDAFEEALNIRTEELGVDHFDISSTLNAIGLIHFKQGLLDLAIGTFKESLEIRLKQDKPDSGDIAVVLFNIAAIYFEIGEIDKSIDFYKQTLLHESKASKEKQIDIIATLQRLAEIYEQIGEFNKALEYYEEAVVYCINNPENRPTVQVSRLLNSVGTIYLQMGDTTHAVEAFVKATRINHLAGIEESNHVVHNEIDICDAIKTYSEAAAAA